MKRIVCILSMASVFILVSSASSEEIKIKKFRGVVTLQLLPAKAIKINNIVENPKPGNSYIGKKSILVEVDENPNVMVNWSVVNIKYYKYPKPKIIKYEIFSEQKQLTVNYHAVSVKLDGDLSAYIKQE